MSNPAAEWWSSLPPLTKLYGAACLGATLASRLALLSPVQLALLWPLVTRRLQARRSEAGRPRLRSPDFSLT